MDSCGSLVSLGPKLKQVWTDMEHKCWETLETELQEKKACELRYLDEANDDSKGARGLGQFMSSRCLSCFLATRCELFEGSSLSEAEERGLAISASWCQLVSQVSQCKLVIKEDTRRDVPRTRYSEPSEASN